MTSCLFSIAGGFEEQTATGSIFLAANLLGGGNFNVKLEEQKYYTLLLAFSGWRQKIGKTLHRLAWICFSGTRTAVELFSPEASRSHYRGMFSTWP